MDKKVSWIILFLVSVLYDDNYVSTVTIWSMPREVNSGDTYFAMVPFKFDVPPGLTYMNMSIQVARSHAECEDRTVTVLIDHGGLPLIQLDRDLYPPGFITETPTLNVTIMVGQLVAMTIPRPIPGPWFLVAYYTYDFLKDKIALKGVDDKYCMYSYLTRVEIPEATPTISISVNQLQSAEVNTRGTLFSFKVPPSTQSFRVLLSQCDPEPCSVRLAYLPSQMNKAYIKSCTGEPDCSLYIPSPPLNDLHLIEIRTVGATNNQRVTFLIVVTSCSMWPDFKSNRCTTMPFLDRVAFGHAFTVTFGFLFYNSLHFNVDLSKSGVLVVPFEIVSPSDNGGTLRWEVKMLNYTQGLTTAVRLCGALIYNYLPDMTDYFDVCKNVSNVAERYVTGVNFGQIKQYVPYPSTGVWHIILQATCTDKASEKTVPCPKLNVNMSLQLQRCYENGCDDKGTCKISGAYSDLVVYSVCYCDGGYRGYACTDDSKSDSVGTQLAAAYLLTVSNLAFLPAIIISIKRRFLVEAFVYTYTMFFSTFYHACDGDRLEIYRLCIAHFNVLQICDFFGSVCSIVYTMLVMANIRYMWITRTLQVVLPMFILIGVVYDVTNACTFLIPVVFGVLVIMVSWGHKMYKRRTLYPSWRRYVFYLLPGTALALTGGAIFIILETVENYHYVHSCWHIAIALCICFLVPPRQPRYLPYYETKDTTELSEVRQAENPPVDAPETVTSHL
ncbi:transmembrane protein 8B-like isoform X2 [Physella acuta]|uniref:transmembrane protein 8B-like isoform X2 n=1 Tax=Physella acuta TaxID=109671 RepID=UPI0027DC7FBD|nr:transmembrane protein 8B-like isoform X2 [Physella acuta]